MLKALASTLTCLLCAFLLLKGYTRRPFLDIEDVVPGLVFDFPVHLQFLPGAPEQLVITERAGRVIWVKRNSTAIEGEILNIEDRVYSAGPEEGLLSAVVDPQYPKRSFLYVFYSKDAPKRSIISRYALDQNLVADKRSEQVLLEVPKIRDTHNGGQLEFDRDGFLMASIGDSEASEDLGEKMIQGKILLGSLIRIDVANSNQSKPFAIPPTNPFAQIKNGHPPEIWAWGFRNPWRYTYDPPTHSWIVADVGATLKEEISQVRVGENHGWPAIEGDVCHHRAYANCDPKTFTAPLASVSHNESVSVTGAAIYRGSTVPALKGRVVFSDYIRGIFSFEYQPGKVTTSVRRDIYKWPTPRGPHAGALYATSSLVIGPDQEIYLVNARGTIGKIRQIGWWKWLRGFLYEMLSFA